MHERELRFASKGLAPHRGAVLRFGLEIALRIDLLVYDLVAPSGLDLKLSRGLSDGALLMGCLHGPKRGQHLAYEINASAGHHALSVITNRIGMSGFFSEFGRAETGPLNG